MSVVMMAWRTHLFPCRTQKLSFSTPKEVGGSLPARIGHCHAKTSFGTWLSVRAWILESCPSWPKEQHWKCCIRVKACIKGSNPLLSVYDPLVKWLRHHPFTVVSWVRIPYGSLFGGLAQLGERLPYKQRVTGSSPVSSIDSCGYGGTGRRARFRFLCPCGVGVRIPLSAFIV